MNRLLYLGLLLFGVMGPGPATSRAASGNEPVFIFSTFKEPEQDGLRFAYSFDGYHWTNVPGLFLKAHVGHDKIMRDPSVCRGPDGTWHVVWTCSWKNDLGFGYAHSKDLVHWSEQKWIPAMTNEPTACNTWAPEIFYNDGISPDGKRAGESQAGTGKLEPPYVGCYIIVWASTIPGRFPDHL